MKKLFLLDAYALIYRAYYALIRSPRVTSRGFNTSAIFGFCNTLREVLAKENPTHIAVCFDPPGGRTFRHEIYEAYKGNRDKQPEDITASLPYIRRILEALAIECIEVDGYEADDIIGTLAQEAKKEGYEVFMMTPDKDYAQLVDKDIWMYRPSIRGEGFEIRNPERICEKYGISSPKQVIDLLALEGDSSDNIPGCPGVGPKTAQKLIAEYGSVENMLAHAGEIKGALGKKIAEHADQIRLSYQLATIKTDCPIDIPISSLTRKEMDLPKLVAVYEELEFKSFINRLGSSAVSVPKPVSATEGHVETPASDLPLLDFEPFIVASTPQSLPELRRAMAFLTPVPTEMAVTFITTGDLEMTSQLRAVVLAWRNATIRIVLPPDFEERKEWMRQIEPLFAQRGGLTLVSTDVKRDMVLMHRLGLVFNAPYFDVSVAHYLIDPETKHDIEAVAQRYFGPNVTPYLNTPEGCTMAALRLRQPLLHDIESREMLPLWRDIELPLIRVLAQMEITGVRIDPATLIELRQQLNDRLDGMLHEAYQMAGEPFNPSSPSQVGEILFEKLKIDPKAKRTPTGSYSTAESVLEKYSSTVPLVALILKMRKLKKLIATYLDTLPTLINPQTGKIHTTFNQTVTATGRISSSNPNLQNIPIRTDDGREIRRAFIADPGDLFMSCDYSQIELRIIADLAQDKEMIDAFASGEDIHRVTASKIYHRTLQEVTDDERRNAKTANFGIIYGISAFGLSERLGIPRAESKALIDGYFATYPHIREYLESSLEKARNTGYAITRMGRRRYLPEIQSRSATVRGFAERNAVNAPIQGTAADIIKVAMVAIYREMKERHMKSAMIMQVHDELLFNVKPDELPQLKELVVRCMSNAYHGAVPLEVSSGVATNWLEAH